MNSRDTFLASIRRASVPAAALPQIPQGIQFADPVQRFAETLASVGGVCVHGGVPEALDVYKSSKRIVSLLDSGKLTGDPKELADVDLAVVNGAFGVAENAAVWIPGANLGRHRALFVIAQHLILMVPASSIVHNMHEAYDQVSLGRGGFGVFVSGPSKTADIEQSLVIGAQGSRSCTVILT